MAIHLFVQGIRTPWPKEAAAEPIAAADIDQFFARAPAQNIPHQHWINAFAGLLSQKKGAIPYARWLAKHYQIAVPEGSQVFVASPVFLQADRDQVFMPSHELVAAEQDEVDAIVNEFNRFYGEDPYHLIASADKAYLFFIAEKPFEITTTPVFEAAFQYVGPNLAKGKDAQAFHQLTNEMQMMCHGMSLNFTREANGKLPINALWLWGEADQSAFQHDIAWIATDNPLTKSIADCAGLNPIDINDELPTGNGVIINTRLQESALDGAWYQWKQDIEQHIQPLFQRFSKSKQTLIVYDGRGQRYWPKEQGFLSRIFRKTPQRFINIAKS